MDPHYPLLILDIGNTDTTFAWHDGSQWLAQWRIPSKDDGLLEEKLDHNVANKGLDLKNLGHILISSVVPHLTPSWEQLLAGKVECMISKVGPDLYKKLPIAVPSPDTIGTDLVANALAAHIRFKQTCIVVDFGTALTFTALDSEGNILGVAIAPGLKTAMYALFQKAAQLPEVPLIVPDSALGQNTTHALQAGILLGYEGLVKGMLDKIKTELGRPTRVIATGGLSSVIESLQTVFDELDRDLTLEGLRLMAGYC
jgi:type III pantothenate kinase